MERERRKEASELKADVETRLEKMEEELSRISAKLEDLYQREGRVLRPVPETLPQPDTIFLSGEDFIIRVILILPGGNMIWPSRVFGTICGSSQIPNFPIMPSIGLANVSMPKANTRPPLRN